MHHPAAAVLGHRADPGAPGVGGTLMRVLRGGDHPRRAKAPRAVMWSPVPSTVPGTDLRRVAALLLHTGLPGVPVAADNGEVLGFVSRADHRPAPRPLGLVACN